MDDQTTQTLHANCISIDGQGVLILGASGSGKSSLTWQMLGLGASLVSDDRTTLIVDGNSLIAKAPASIAGLIEARGLGVLAAPAVQRAKVVAVLDLDRIETERVPEHRSTQFLGVTIPCLYKVENIAFPSMLLHYLRFGRQDIE
jgi:HPr kinase/phosphorylase